MAGVNPRYEDEPPALASCGGWLPSLAFFLPFVETVPVLDCPAELPELSDPDDLMFLALALAGKADALVSGASIFSPRKVV